MNPRLHRDRATWAAFVLGAGGDILASAPRLLAGPIGACTIGGIGALALLYFVVGVSAARAAPDDPMAKFWPAVFAIGSGFLLAGHFYLPSWLGAFNLPVQALYVGTLAASVVCFSVSLRPMPGNELPDPSKVAGLPNAGPASVHDAHARLRRGGASQRPKFRD